MEKRFRAFAAWISSFTVCCCCGAPIVPPKTNQEGAGGPVVQQTEPTAKTDDQKTAKVERISRANFDRIQDNMTIAEVRAILGPGQEPNTKAKAVIRQFIWHGTGERAQVRIRVTFNQGRVANKTIEGE